MQKLAEILTSQIQYNKQIIVLDIKNIPIFNIGLIVLDYNRYEKSILVLSIQCKLYYIISYIVNLQVSILYKRLKYYKECKY